MIFMYVVLWRRQNYGDGKQVGVCRGQRWWRQSVESGREISTVMERYLDCCTGGNISLFL